MVTVPGHCEKAKLCLSNVKNLVKFIAGGCFKESNFITLINLRYEEA